MSEKYDGWCLKNCETRKPYLLEYFFASLRKDVVDRIDKRVGEGYKLWRKRVGGNYKIVKVKLVEVGK